MQEWTKLIGPVFMLSVVLLVFAIGMRTSWYDVTYLFHRPALLLRSVLARNVLVPASALFVTQVFSLDVPVMAAILALSVAPVPPILPHSLLKAGGRDPYVIGLLASQSLLAIVFVPVILLVFNRVLGLHAHFAPRDVVPIILKMTVIPLLLGLGVRYAWPLRSDKIAREVHMIGTMLIAAAMLGVVTVAWQAWVQLLGNGTLIAMIVFIGVALAAGHLLGGPREEDRTSLALACTSSHPGLAMALLTVNSPAMLKPAIAAVFLYLIVHAVVSIPYKKARTPVPQGVLYRVAERRSARRPGPDRRRAVS